MTSEVVDLPSYPSTGRSTDEYIDHEADQDIDRGPRGWLDPHFRVGLLAWRGRSICHCDRR